MSELKENSTEENEYVELYFVVKNNEEQYSIWPSYKQIPNGWESIGEPKIKSDCLEYIEKNWTDMRPLSLRKSMEDMEASASS